MVRISLHTFPCLLSREEPVAPPPLSVGWRHSPLRAQPKHYPGGSASCREELAGSRELATEFVLMLCCEMSSMQFKGNSRV